MSLATGTIYRNNFKSKHYTLQQYRHSSSYKVVMYIQKLHHFCNRSPPLMMAQSQAESTWKINNYGRYINQFPPNIMKSIQQYERITKKIWRQKMSIMFNEIYIYIYIYDSLERQSDSPESWSDILER